MKRTVQLSTQLSLATGMMFLEALYDNTDAQAVLIKDSIYQSVIKDSYSSYIMMRLR